MKKCFIWVGRLEGASFLILLGVAMPLKYIYGIPEATRAVGLAHGLLFISYVALAAKLSDVESWTGAKLGKAFLSAFLPLGTFYFEKKILPH
jgi:integral membrane protein